MYTHDQAIHKVQTGELWLTYLLYALFFTIPVAVLLSLGKAIQYRYQLKQGDRPDAKELRMLTDHYEWLNHTALVALLLGMIAVGTAFYFVGYFFAVAAVVWWVYRIGRGIMALLDYKSPPVAVQG